ncbi:MAG: hypothetical protein JW982_03870 [Spirochaetes bacterium]|nr:hypothetical protein [Spirochaetota bacterium]
MSKENNSTNLMEELNEFSENVSEGISDDGGTFLDIDPEIEFSEDSDIEQLNPDVTEDHFDLTDIDDSDLMEFSTADFVEEEYDGNFTESGSDETAEGIMDDFPLETDDDPFPDLTDTSEAASINRISSIEESDGSELEEEEVNIEEIVREVDLLSDFTASKKVSAGGENKPVKKIEQNVAAVKNEIDKFTDDDDDFVITNIEGYPEYTLDNFIHKISEENIGTGKSEQKIPKVSETGSEPQSLSADEDFDVVFEELDKDLDLHMTPGKSVSNEPKKEAYHDKIVIDIPDSLTDNLPDDFMLEPIDLAEAEMVANEDILLLNEEDLIQELDSIHLKPLNTDKVNRPPAVNSPEIEYLGKSGDKIDKADEEFIIENSESSKISVITDEAINNTEPADEMDSIPEAASATADDSGIDSLFDPEDNFTTGLNGGPDSKTEINADFEAMQVPSSEPVYNPEEEEDLEVEFIPVTDNVSEIPDITSRIVIIDEENVNTFVTDNIEEKKQKDMKRLLAYLDGLFENLPEELIKKFADSEYFDLYVKIMNDLGV